MTILENWVATPAAKALGWTLFYSLAEGAAVALVLAVVLWTSRRSRFRYAAACVAVVAMLAGFGATFAWQLSQQQAHGRFAKTLLFPPPPDDSAGPLHAARRSVPFTASDILPWLAPFWMAGVLAFHLRSLAGWMAARRFCRTAVCRAADPWPERLDRLRARVGLSRPVALLESGLATVPVAAGYLRPVILMPAGLLTGLPAGQIESILLHELAHIRRADYLVNLLQTFVEGLLFYHPAAWWVSGVIRAERENCCDDLVVATLGNAGEYAAALAALEANRAAVPAMAAAATGGSLVNRIRRLLIPGERPKTGLPPVIAAFVLTLAQAQVQAPQPDGAAAHAPSPFERWLNEDVAYIIAEPERRAYLELRTDEERNHFIGQFWERRNPTPGSAENPFKEEHYRRIAYANGHFKSSTTAGWKTDRGRAYIMYGPPNEIESHPSGGTYVKPASEGGGIVNTYAFETWLYKHIDGVGDNVIVEFVDKAGSGDYRHATSPSEKYAPLDAPPPVPKNLPPVPGPTANRAGAAVQLLGDGVVQVVVPLQNYGSHSVTVYGRLLSSSQRVVGAFEERPKNGPVFSKATKLPAGSYKWFVAVRDLTTGTVYTDDLPFAVK
jgi:GWxTD domain-containing protein